MGGSNVRLVTGHTSDAVVSEHYLDKKLMAKAVKDFEVFSKEIPRKEELQDIRNNKTEDKEKGIEK